MIKNNRLYLIGMPGSGKTTFGQYLAKKLNYKFLDLDSYILEKHHQYISIHEIFEQKGETFFRILEKQALEQTKNEKFTLIAAGGGTPCFFNNIEIMINSGLTVFLNPSLNLIQKHIQQQDQRPLFKNYRKEELNNMLKEMYEWRLPFYQKAHITINNLNSGLKFVLKS